MKCASGILSSVACPTLQFFPTLSQKGYDFLKQFIKRKMCFDFTYNFLNISLFKEN